MFGLSVKIPKDRHIQGLALKELEGLLKKEEKFGFSWYSFNHPVDKGYIGKVEKVLIFCNYKSSIVGYECDIERSFLSKEEFIPDELKEVVGSKETPSKTWLVLKNLVKVEEGYLSECIAVKEGYSLLDLGKSGSRFKIAYYFRDEE